MAFEARERGGDYYYRKKRVGQSVVSEYVGGGLTAQMAALLDAEERNENRRKLEIERQTQAEFEQTLAQFKEFAGKVKDLVEATLLINGYHLTRNRIWRRSKTKMEITVDASKQSPEKAAQLKTLITKVDKQNPQPEDLAALRRELDDDPRLYRNCADLAEQTERQVITDHFNSSALGQEFLERQLRDMRDSLGWAAAAPVEKLVIRQVCLAYLVHYVAELRKQQITKAQHSLREGLYWQKTIDNTQKRYLRAIETLAKVKGLTARTEEIESRARAVRSSNTLKSANLLKALTT